MFDFFLYPFLILVLSWGFALHHAKKEQELGIALKKLKICILAIGLIFSFFGSIISLFGWWLAGFAEIPTFLLFSIFPSAFFSFLVAWITALNVYATTGDKTTPSSINHSENDILLDDDLII